MIFIVNKSHKIEIKVEIDLDLPRVRLPAPLLVHPRLHLLRPLYLERLLDLRSQLVLPVEGQPHFLPGLVGDGAENLGVAVLQLTADDCGDQRLGEGQGWGWFFRCLILN